MLLADLGAEVVKVERPPDGDDTRAWGPPWSADGQSTYFLGVNRNKRSVALDLGSEDGLAAARALVERADVVVENFKPGEPGPARAGLRRGPRRQPRRGLRLDHRLRPRGGSRPARLRPARPGRGRADERHRAGAGGADQGRRRAGRRRHRAARGGRGARRAAASRAHRAGAAGRGQPAVLAAVGAGQPDQRLRRRRRRAGHHRQPAPVDRAVRDAADRGPADRARRGQRPAVPGAVRGARPRRSSRTTRGSPRTRPGSPPATSWPPSCRRSWRSGRPPSGSPC